MGRSLANKILIPGSFSGLRGGNYHCFETWITEDAKCEINIRRRIAMVKKAFREKHSVLTTNNIQHEFKKRGWGMGKTFL